MASGLKLLDMYVEVKADASKVADDAAGQIESGSGKIIGKGNEIGRRFAGAIAGAFAAEKIGEFLTDAVSEASDLNETISASQQIFGSYAASIERWGNTAAKSMGLSKKEAIDSATQFGNMFLQLGIGHDKATDMSKSMVQMAADFGSFNNLPTADVLDSISGAMRGEYDSLQRIIPNISAARVQQEALNETHKKNASSLTAAEKAQATMNILQKDGARMTGDFARTSGGLANQQKIAAAQTENLKAQIGTNLLPVVKSITSFLNATVLPALAGMARWLSKNQWILPPLAVALGIATAAIIGITIATWAMNTALLANPITWIIIGIVALIAAIVLLIMNWSKVTAWLGSVFGPMIAWVVNVWNGLVANFAFGGQQIINFIVTAWNRIIAAFAFGGQQIIGFVVGLWNGTISRFAYGGRQIIGFVVGAWNGIVSRFAYGGQQIVSFVQTALGRIRNFFAGIGGWARDAGVALLRGFIGGIQSMIGAVVGTVKSFMDKVASFFPHSPAKEGPFSGKGWTPYSGRATAEGFAQGLTAGIPSVRSSASAMMDAAAAGPANLALNRPTKGGWATDGSPAAAASSAAAGDTHVYYVTIDARSVDEIQKVTRVFSSLKQGARQGAGTTAAVGG